MHLIFCLVCMGQMYIESIDAARLHTRLKAAIFLERVPTCSANTIQHRKNLAEGAQRSTPACMLWMAREDCWVRPCVLQPAWPWEGVLFATEKHHPPNKQRPEGPLHILTKPLQVKAI